MVTADNGESFLTHTNRHLEDPATVEDIADTPLFIKRPFEHSGPTFPIATYGPSDILPTIADVLGVDMPVAGGRRVGLRPAASIPSNVEVYQRSGRKLTLTLREVQAPHRRLAQTQDHPVRLEWSATRLCSASVPMPG